MAGGLPTHEQAMNRKISIVFIVGAVARTASPALTRLASRRHVDRRAAQ
jgi:hypothetical protein